MRNREDQYCLNITNINSVDKHHRNVIFDVMPYGDEKFIMYLLSQEKIDFTLTPFKYLIK